MENQLSFETAKAIYNSSKNKEVLEALETIFPKLCESEDKKIRKAILELVRQSSEILDKQNQNNMLAWLEKQGEKNNNEDADILQRFSFYSYKDEPNVLYLSNVFVNEEYRNKGIGTKILKIADEVSTYLKCNSIRLKTENGSNAESLYRKNGYKILTEEGKQIWLEKQAEKKDDNKLIWKHWSKGIAGNGDGKPIYLIKHYNTYSISSCLSFECDYILLSDLDKLISDGDVDVRYKYLEEILKADDIYQMSINDTMAEEAKSKAIEALSKLGIGKLLWFEKQDEQESSDKIEPKFHEGDFIKHNKANIICKVISVNSGSYYVENIETSGRIELFNAEQNFHLWTINDAKDGDVLSINWHVSDDSWEKIIIFKKYHNKGVKGLFNAPCVEGYGNTFKNGELAFNEEVPYYSKTWTCNLHPAAKEQRNFLLQKMKEADYLTK